MYNVKLQGTTFKLRRGGVGLSTYWCVWQIKLPNWVLYVVLWCTVTTPLLLMSELVNLQYHGKMMDHILIWNWLCIWLLSYSIYLRHILCFEFLAKTFNHLILLQFLQNQGLLVSVSNDNDIQVPIFYRLFSFSSVNIWNSDVGD